VVPSKGASWVTVVVVERTEAHPKRRDMVALVTCDRNAIEGERSSAMAEDGEVGVIGQTNEASWSRGVGRGIKVI